MQSPAVLMLDDGELDDVQQMLEETGVAFGRVRGGAIAENTPAPSALLIATPRRIDAVRRRGIAAGGQRQPMRIVVVEEDSPTLRAQLRAVGFDYLVRRPVHVEALRLLLLRCLYQGDERRGATRVPLGWEVSFEAGALSRRATLADLSTSGCRLRSPYALKEGARLVVQLVVGGDEEALCVGGEVVRVEVAPAGGRPDAAERHTAAVRFDPVSESVALRIEELIARHQQASGIEARGDAAGAGNAGAQNGESAVEVRIEPRVEEVPVLSESSELAGESSGDRRRGQRVAFGQKVPAFGGRALRVLVGRDLSTGGMRIERLPDLEIGDRLHLAVYGRRGEEPLLIWATVARDDGDEGMGVLFDELQPPVAETLEKLVAGLPAVESLQGEEADAMGTVVSEILDSAAGR